MNPENKEASLQVTIQNTDRPSTPNLRNLLPHLPIILGVIPVITYILIYIHEYTYCEIYHIPIQYIRINLIDAIAIGAVLAIVLSHCSSWLTAIVSNRYSNNTRIFVRYLPLVMASVTFAKLHGNVYYILSPLIIAAFIILVDMYKIRKAHVRSQGLKAIFKQHSDEPLINVLSPLYERIAGKAFAMIVPYVVVAPGVALISAYCLANGKTDYIIPGKYPNSVVLRIYDETIICAHTNFQQRTVNGELLVLENKLEATGILYIRHAGPLEYSPSAPIAPKAKD